MPHGPTVVSLHKDNSVQQLRFSEMVQRMKVVAMISGAKPATSQVCSPTGKASYSMNAANPCPSFDINKAHRRLVCDHPSDGSTLWDPQCLMLALIMLCLECSNAQISVTPNLSGMTNNFDCYTKVIQCHPSEI